MQLFPLYLLTSLYMKILLLSALFLFTLNVKSQQLVNGGFEDWIWDYGTPYPRPAGWECNNYKMNARRENLPVQACVIYRTGTFSTILWSMTDTVTNSRIPAHMWQSVALHGQRPDMLKLYARYDITPDDPAVIEVEFFHSGGLLHKESLQLTGMAHADSFEVVELPIHYTYQLLPDSAVVHIRNSIATTSSGFSSVISIDDIRFVYNYSKSIGDVFPNPGSGVHYILAEGFENAALTIDLYDISGRLLSQQEYFVQYPIENIVLEPLERQGIFFYQFRSGSDNYVRKLVISE
jgi:hypothetical protein